MISRDMADAPARSPSSPPSPALARYRPASAESSRQGLGLMPRPDTLLDRARAGRIVNISVNLAGLDSVRCRALPGQLGARVAALVNNAGISPKAADGGRMGPSRRPSYVLTWRRSIVAPLQLLCQELIEPLSRQPRAYRQRRFHRRVLIIPSRRCDTYVRQRSRP